MRKLSIAIVVGFALACGGGSGQKPTKRKNPYEADQAERARLRGEYARAEAILRARLKENRDDHVAHLLMGDVNLTRGQHFTRKWKENLTRAFDSYSRAVKLKPDDPIYWARVANAVEMASINELTRIPRERIQELPLEKGWESCPGAAMFSLTLAMQPYAEELEDQQKLDKKANEWQLLDRAAPWIRQAFADVPLAQVEWLDPPPPLPPTPGGLFVVLEPPVQAKGQGHGNHRPIAGLETFSAQRVSGDRVVFVDRRFPKLLPRQGLVLANACKYTQWKNSGAGRVPKGRCTRGPFVRSMSSVWDPAGVKIASPAHYTEASAAVSKIPADQIYWETGVRCLGKPVGRKIEYEATCEVEFDQPNWLTRWVPTSVARGARSQEHADQMIRARGMRDIMGEELSTRMIDSQVGPGMPYGLMQYAFPDMKGCQGRALLHRHVLNGGQIDFACEVDGTAYHFTDLQLVWLGPPDELGKEPPPE